MSLAAMQGSANGSSVRYYPTRKHSPLKERNEQVMNMLDVCSAMNRCVSLSLTNRKSSVHLHALCSPRTAVRTFTARWDQHVICGQYSC
jgi:hypothetical protein